MPLASAALSPARNSHLASTSASAASDADGGRAQEVRLGGRTGGRVDQVVQLAPGPPPAAPVAAGGRECSSGELDRHSAVDADRPGPAACRDVAARVDQAGPGSAEQLGRSVGRVALADPAEIEVDARLELDPRAVQPSRRPRTRRRRCSAALRGTCSNERS